MYTILEHQMVPMYASGHTMEIHARFGYLNHVVIKLNRRTVK